MTRSILVSALAAIAITASVAGAGENCSTPRGSAAQAQAGDACGTGGKTANASASARGKLTGRFDSIMSGACRFACATKLKYDRRSVMAQPGARTGKLTQCPVSGVVFAVDAERPHVRIGREQYVTCCDKCAAKLTRDPRRYLKV